MLKKPSLPLPTDAELSILLWRGALVAALLAVALVALRGHTARTRYLVSVV